LAIKKGVQNQSSLFLYTSIFVCENIVFQEQTLPSFSESPNNFAVSSQAKHLVEEIFFRLDKEDYS
jgi:hypothetical protein